MMQRLRTLFVLTFLVALLGVPAAIAGSSSGDNVSTATNRTNDTRVSDFDFSIERQRGGVVDNRNQADAYSSCIRCGATAIAFQIVLVSGKPSEVRPVNVATAVNENCQECQTYAGARQFVRVTPKPVKLTEDGEEEVESIRSALRKLSRSMLPALEIAPKVDAQANRLKSVLSSELVTSDGRDSRDKAKDGTDDEVGDDD